MDFLIVVMPGFALGCSLIMFGLMAGQLFLYNKNGNKRSRDLAIFCLVTGLFSLLEAIFHSRSISITLFKYLCEAGFPVIFLASIFYLRSMTYFIIVPRWVRRSFYYGQGGLAFLATLPILHLLIFGTSIFVNEANKVETGNYFMDTYSMTLGKTYAFPHIILSLSSVLNILLAFVMLFRIRESSRDYILITGLVFTIVASGTEMLLLPFTVQFFVPVLFLSNFFEAFRMNYLVFSEESEEDVEEKPREERSESYKEASIDEQRIAQLAARLNQLVKSESLYRDPNLNLARLASHLKIPSYLLTQVLRFGLNTNYYEYISEFRIEDVKAKMQSAEYKHLSIIEIAYSAGFNSKSSFNVAFKKQTNMTPKQFRQKIAAGEPQQSI